MPDLDSDQPTDRPAEQSRRRPVSRRALILGAGGLAAVAAGGAVVWSQSGGAAVTPAAAPVPAAPAPAAPVTLPSAAALNAHHAGDAAFFGTFKLEGAMELERYATVEAMAKAASVTVVGRVKSIGTTRIIRGEGGDQVAMIGMAIEPMPLKGDLRTADRQELVVEFVGGSDGAESVAKLSASMPKGYAVWFLRSKAEEVAQYKASMKRLNRTITATDAARLAVDAKYYRLVSSQGLYLQGSQEVENPVVDTHDPGNKALLKRTDKIDKLSELVEKVQDA